MKRENGVCDGSNDDELLGSAKRLKREMPDLQSHGYRALLNCNRRNLVRCTEGVGLKEEFTAADVGAKVRYSILVFDFGKCFWDID